VTFVEKQVSCWK